MSVPEKHLVLRLRLYLACSLGGLQDGILDVVTSGQIAWEGLRQRVAEPFKSLGKKCLVFGNGDDDLEVTKYTLNSTNLFCHTEEALTLFKEKSELTH